MGGEWWDEEISTDLLRAARSMTVKPIWYSSQAWANRETFIYDKQSLIKVENDCSSSLPSDCHSNSADKHPTILCYFSDRLEEEKEETIELSAREDRRILQFSDGGGVVVAVAGLGLTGVSRRRLFSASAPATLCFTLLLNIRRRSSSISTENHLAASSKTHHDNLRIYL